MRHIYGENANSLVRFEFVEEDETSPEEYLELAKKARDLGLTVDIQKLKELTHLTFIGDKEQDLWQPEQAE